MWRSERLAWTEDESCTERRRVCTTTLIEPTWTQRRTRPSSRFAPRPQPQPELRSPQPAACQGSDRRPPPPHHQRRVHHTGSLTGTATRPGAFAARNCDEPKNERNSAVGANRQPFGIRPNDSTGTGQASRNGRSRWCGSGPLPESWSRRRENSQRTDEVSARPDPVETIRCVGVTRHFGSIKSSRRGVAAIRLRTPVATESTAGPFPRPIERGASAFFRR